MIALEALSPDQFELVASWLSRPDTNRWLSSEWRDRVTTASMIAILLRNRRNRLFMVNFDGAPAGLVGLSDIDLPDKTAMVWYILGDLNLSGRGITTVAVRLVLDIAFRDLGLCSLYAWVMEDNLPSLKVLDKAGFKRSGHLRLTANSWGRQVDRIYFDLTHEDYVHISADN